MNMNIMTSNGSIVPRRTVIHLTMAEINTIDAKMQCVIFDNLIRKKQGALMNLPLWTIEVNGKMKAIDHSFIPYKDDEVEHHSMTENDFIDMYISLVNAFVNAKFLLPSREESEGYEGSNLVRGKVIRHFCNEDGNVMGSVAPV